MPSLYRGVFGRFQHYCRCRNRTSEYTAAAARPPARYQAIVIALVCGVRRLGALPRTINGWQNDPADARGQAQRGAAEVSVLRRTDTDQRVVRGVRQQITRESDPLQRACARRLDADGFHAARDRAAAEHVHPRRVVRPDAADGLVDRGERNGAGQAAAEGGEDVGRVVGVSHRRTVPLHGPADERQIDPRYAARTEGSANVADVIDIDVKCEQCGYNLRGLDPHHRCPECARPYSFGTTSPRAPRRALGGFERFCAAGAFILGVALGVSGVFGQFLGVEMSITLPPVLGGLCALIGWGIIRSVIIAWRAPAPLDRSPHVPSIYRDPIPPSAEPIDREIDRMRAAERSDAETFDVIRDDLKPPAT